MRNIAEYRATRKSQHSLVAVGVREKRKICYTSNIQIDIRMAQSAFSDDDDDSGFDPPSSRGSFVAQGRASVGGGGGRWSSSASRDPFGVSPREKKPLTEVEKLQEEIANLEKQQEEKKAEQETAAGEGKSAEEELRKRQERKVSFLQSYAQSFEGKTPSLGNFEEELGFFEERKSASGEKEKRAGEELKSLQKEIEEKKKALIVKQEEEKGKQEDASREESSTQRGSHEQRPESLEGTVETAPKPSGISDGVKDYWGALSWEEKKKIFSVRDTIVQEVSEGFLSWEDFLNRFESLASGDAFHEINLEKMRETKDRKGSALLLSIVAHRGGKIQDLEDELTQ